MATPCYREDLLIVRVFAASCDTLGLMAHGGRGCSVGPQACGRCLWGRQQQGQRRLCKQGELSDPIKASERVWRQGSGPLGAAVTLLGRQE